jgi:hypothetical protein
MAAFSLVPSPDGSGDPGAEPSIESGDQGPATSEPAVTTKGTVVQIEDGIASVLVGPERESWDFPVEMLPASVAVDTVLVLERTGRTLRFVELDPATEVVRGRPFDLRLRRTARKVPYMRVGSMNETNMRRAR